jgi:hypothetical protein
VSGFQRFLQATRKPLALELRHGQTVEGMRTAMAATGRKPTGVVLNSRARQRGGLQVRGDEVLGLGGGKS